MVNRQQRHWRDREAALDFRCLKHDIPPDIQKPVQPNL